jgi:hypothetical protein
MSHIVLPPYLLAELIPNFPDEPALREFVDLVGN